MLVNHILNTKGCEVITIGPTATLERLLQLLTVRNVGAAVVVEKDRLVGIVSERDVVRRLALDGKWALDLQVAAVMTRDLVTCSPSDTLHDVMSLMTDRRCRHVPVIAEDGLMQGLVSIGDVVKHRVEELDAEAQLLRDYVQAR
jgi:CBS domain-containing protein